MINDDAMVWLDEHPGQWDAIIVDFPDPNTFALGKLYTKLFYRRVLAHLAPGGAVSRAGDVAAVRAQVVLVHRRDDARGRASRCSRTTSTVPSFGVWGYVLARRAPFEPPAHVPNGRCGS